MSEMGKRRDNGWYRYLTPDEWASEMNAQTARRERLRRERWLRRLQEMMDRLEADTP